MASQFGISSSATFRHKKNCVARELDHGDELLNQLQSLSTSSPVSLAVSSTNGEPVTWLVHEHCGDTCGGHWYCIACHEGVATTTSKGKAPSEAPTALARVDL